MKYQLLLKDVLRYTERANLIKERNDLLKAVEIMLVVPKAADDMMNVGRLNGFPGKLTAQGKLIKQGILLFCDLTPILNHLDAQQLQDILTQFENRNSHNNNNDNNNNNNNNSKSILTSGEVNINNNNININSNSSLSNNQLSSYQSDGSASLSEKILLNTNSIGTSQMNDKLRICLNQLLSNAVANNQIKLRERQTFLFEQTIIFSEVNRKSTSSSQAVPTRVAATISGPLSSNGSQSAMSASSTSGGLGTGGQSSAVPTNNHHPCYPHSHNAQGAVESCCELEDCNLPPSASLHCDRLMTSSLAAAHSLKMSNNNQSIESGDEFQHLENGEKIAPTTTTTPITLASTNNQKSPKESHRNSLAFIGNSLSSNSKRSFYKHGNNQKDHHQIAGQLSEYHHHHPVNQTAISYSMPTYEYKNHLSINKVALIDKHYGPSVDLNQLYALFGQALDLDTESRRFMLKSRDPNQDNVIYLLQTGCSFDRDDWVCSIKSMLECQLDFLRALQSPIAYQRGLTKEG